MVAVEFKMKNMSTCGNCYPVGAFLWGKGMEQLKIEYVPIGSIKPYEGNAKLHPEEQVEQIKKSIVEVGFRDPIGVWNGVIVEGHGRYIAAQELGMKEVPVIRLDDMTDEQRKAYGLIHNKLTMNSDFDFDKLQEELDALNDIDMSQFGFETLESIGDINLDDETVKDRCEITLRFQNAADWQTVKEKIENLCNEVNASISEKMA